MDVMQFITLNLQTLLLSIIGKHSMYPFQPLAEMFLSNVFSSMGGIV